MVDTYSSKAFIAFDGPDATGLRAEVKVVDGVGDIESVKASKKGKSSLVTFSVSNTEYTTSGWAPNDSNIMTVVKAAKEAGEPIHFRVETRRQDHVDRSLEITPISNTTELALKNIHKSLAAVKRIDDTDWTISSFAVTNMKEDPQAGGLHSAAHLSDEELEKLRQPTQGSSPSTSNNGASNGGGAFHNCGGREGAPFMTKNRDGSINPGGMATAAPLNIFSFVLEHIREHGYVDEVTKERRNATVTALLNTCNSAQMAIYGDELERPDLAAGSHTRARALVFESVKSLVPLTPEIMNDNDALDKWTEETLEFIVPMWKWGIAQVNKTMFK